MDINTKEAMKIRIKSEVKWKGTSENRYQNDKRFENISKLKRKKKVTILQSGDLSLIDETVLYL